MVAWAATEPQTRVRTGPGVHLNFIRLDFFVHNIFHLVILLIATGTGRPHAKLNLDCISHYNIDLL